MYFLLEYLRIQIFSVQHNDWLRSHFREGFKDAPIIRIDVDGKYDPNKDYRQDYTRRRKKTASE